MPKITISLISVNQRHHIELLLPTLAPAAQLADAEILLVDNRCKDGTSEFVKQNFPNISVMQNPQKTGYGGNHNLNLARAQGEYFVIMNSDMVIVQQDGFVRLEQYMDQHPDVGIVTPKVLSENGNIQGLNKRYPTLADLFLRRFAPVSFRRLFQQRLDYYEMRDIGYEYTCDVPFLSGAFMFCRTDLLKSLGGFDPAYFLYFEDVDLCRRVQRTHRTVYFPDVPATHTWERSAHKKWIYTYYFMKSALRYFTRWGFRLF